MIGKLDQDAGKVKIESDLACLTSAKARNTLRTRPSRFRVGAKRHLVMHQLHFSIRFIRLNPALGTGGGQPAHA
jgi:hypothetical protein